MTILTITIICNNNNKYREKFLPLISFNYCIILLYFMFLLFFFLYFCILCYCYCNQCNFFAILITLYSCCYFIFLRCFCIFRLFFFSQFNQKKKATIGHIQHSNYHNMLSIDSKE